MTLPHSVSAAVRPGNLNSHTALAAPVDRTGEYPLCVDLDGTLIRTDTIFECFLLVLRTAPLNLFRILFSLFSGKARFKRELARSAGLQVECLPYAEDVLTYLRGEQLSGRRLLLATGADSAIAMPIAVHLGLFSDVICSDGDENVTGKRKLAAIRRVLAGRQFVYAGDSRADLEVWKGAEAAVIVGQSRGVRRAVDRAGVRVEKCFARPRLTFKVAFKAMRVHQWTKNILVLIPIVLAHRIFERDAVINGIRSFLAFSFCASALYLINDILDLPTDRKHPNKRLRPLALGELSISSAIAMSAVLLTCAAFLTPTGGAKLILLAYGALVIAYSVYLKRLLMVDVILLATFYTLRIQYGGAGTGVPVSIWTLAFAVFVFLSLALIKRISELRMHFSEEGLMGSGRAYLTCDISMLSGLCAASGCVGALVTILYINSPEVAVLYPHPIFLLGISPLLIYWQGRMLILANRGWINQDPVLFAISDRASRALVVAICALLVAATI